VLRKTGTWICGSHCEKYEDYDFPGGDAVQSGRNVSKFRRNVLPLSSRPERKASRAHAVNKKFYRVMCI
jgi:hypothetical protein